MGYLVALVDNIAEAEIMRNKCDLFITDLILSDGSRDGSYKFNQGKKMGELKFCL